MITPPLDDSSLFAWVAAASDEIENQFLLRLVGVEPQVAAKVVLQEAVNAYREGTWTVIDQDVEAALDLIQGFRYADITSPWETWEALASEEAIRRLQYQWGTLRDLTRQRAWSRFNREPGVFPQFGRSVASVLHVLDNYREGAAKDIPVRDAVFLLKWLLQLAEVVAGGSERQEAQWPGSRPSP